MEWLLYFLKLLFLYFVGAIPFGYILSRWKASVDLRSKFSGATGATNSARILGIKYFFIVFLLDFLRAIVLMQINSSILHVNEFITIVLLMLANSFSVYIGFYGGKGVATGMGIIFFISKLVFSYLLALWMIFFALTRVVGVASVCAYSILFMSYPFIDIPWIGLLSLVFICIFVLVRHRDNINAMIYSNFNRG